MELEINKQSLLLEGKRYTAHNLHLLKEISEKENASLPMLYDFL